MFEILLPRTALFEGKAIADHWDIVYYSLGALLAAISWKIWYLEPKTRGRHRVE
jgi:hypothetical protein